MTRKLPISLCLYTSSKGHWGRSTDYRVTLDHWDKQVPLQLFGQLVAHVKATEGQEWEAAGMAQELRDRGFHVICTTGTWARGLSHQAAYMQDVITVSKEPRVYTQPFYLHLEDDTPLICRGCSLEDLLLQSCRLLEENHELVTVRTIRAGDYAGGVPVLAPALDGRAFYSPNLDFQTPIMRSASFYHWALWLERNPEACQTIQCEMLARVIMDQFSRSPHRHLVWHPDWASAEHIGVAEPDHSATLARLGLKQPHP